MSTIQEMFAEEIRLATEISHKGLLEGFQRNKLLESIFRESFLPFFTNSSAVTPDNPVYAYWVGVAGSPTSEVDIINDAGEVLFTVPALLNTNSLEILQDRHKSPPIKDMYMDYAQMSQGLAPVATNMWNRSLNEKMKDIISDNAASIQTDRQKWEKIYQFYNLPLPQAQQETQTTNEAPLEYE